jgi:DNA-binding MarR family transcriptional regulator
MNAMLQLLIDRELVARPRRAGGGRALPATLTPVGVRTLDEAQVLVDRVEQQMLSGLTSSESSALAHALAECVSSLAD